MTRTLLTLFCIIFAADAHAISRYTSTSMSCERVQATIRRDGAAIMRHASTRNPGLQLFQRYVADGRYCSGGEAAVATTIPSADDKTCWVRECQTVEYDELFLFPGRH